MIRALLGDHWRQVEVVTVLRHGCRVACRNREMFKQFRHIRWISDNWYEVARRRVA